MLCPAAGVKGRVQSGCKLPLDQFSQYLLWQCILLLQRWRIAADSSPTRSVIGVLSFFFSLCLTLPSALFMAHGIRFSCYARDKYEVVSSTHCTLGQWYKQVEEMRFLLTVVWSSNCFYWASGQHLLVLLLRNGQQRANSPLCILFHFFDFFFFCIIFWGI